MLLGAFFEIFTENTSNTINKKKKTFWVKKKIENNYARKK